jgi:hypothetical protein
MTARLRRSGGEAGALVIVETVDLLLLPHIDLQ